MKSLLGLSFYPSLSTGEFHENCRLFLTQIDYHADYTLFAKGYVNESHMETGCDEIRPQLPLIGHRRYYLELFTNDLHVNHPQKTPEVVQDHLELFSYDSLTKSRRIVSIDHCRENRLKTIRVLGLVQDKTRLFHYGERMQKNSFPFRFELTLRDATSDLKVTFWGQSCRYFHAIRPGQVIQLEGYEMKQNKSEIAMNAKSIVYIVEQYRSLLNQLSFLPAFELQGEFCQGLLTWVSELNITNGYTYRWVKVADYQAQVCRVVKLYENSQPVTFGGLKPGQMVVLSQLRVKIPDQLFFSTHQTYTTVIKDCGSTALPSFPSALTQPMRSEAVEQIYPNAIVSNDIDILDNIDLHLHESQIVLLQLTEWTEELDEIALVKDPIFQEQRRGNRKSAKCFVVSLKRKSWGEIATEMVLYF